MRPPSALVLANNVTEPRLARTRGRPGTRARKPSRRIPAPPELAAMLREHIARFGAGPDGRIFRSERGNPIQASTWWQVSESPGRLAHTRAA